MAEPSIDDILAMDLGVEEAEQMADTLSPSTEDVDSILNMRTVDNAIGVPIRSELSGADPESAINEPILDIADRAKMQLGNEEGNVSYLKEKFADAAVNSAGRITVKAEDGKWYYADPNLSEDWDAWEQSKELFADTVIDAIQPGMLAAGAVAGGAAGTLVAPGAGTAGGAVTGVAFAEYLRTSMGRYVGTYEATPVEQTRDIAFETVMEYTGNKIMPGQKPTFRKVYNAMEKTAKNFGKKAGDVVWDFWGSLATSPAATRTFRENPKRVLKIMKENGGFFSRPADFIDNVTKSKVAEVERLAKSANQMLSKAYVSTRDKIVKDIPENFQGDARMYAASAYAQFLDQGTSKLIKPDGTAVRNADELAKTMRWVKDNNRLPKGWKVQFKSQEEIRQLVNSGLPVDNALRRAAVDADAYSAIKQAHDVFEGFAQYKYPARFRDGKVLAQRGRGEAARLLDDKKALSQLLYGIADNPKLTSMGDVSGYINGLRKQMDDVTTGHLGKYGKQYADAFTEMNGIYSQYKDELMPLTQAEKRAKTQGKQAYETLMNQLATKPGKNIAKKEGIDNLLSLAKRMDDKAAIKKLSYMKEGLDAADAALALNPLVTKRSASVGMGAYAVLSKNEALFGSLGLMSAATNATAQQAALRANYHLWNGLKQIKSMSARDINFLMDNPAAVTSIIRSISSAEERQQSVESAFANAFPPAPLRGPGDE